MLPGSRSFFAHNTLLSCFSGMVRFSLKIIREDFNILSKIVSVEHSRSFKVN